MLQAEVCLGAPLQLIDGKIMVLTSDDDNNYWISLRNKGVLDAKLHIIQRSSDVLQLFAAPHVATEADIKVILDSLATHGIAASVMRSAIDAWMGGNQQAACHMIYSVAHNILVFPENAIKVDFSFGFSWLPTTDSAPVAAATAYHTNGYQIIALHTVIGWDDNGTAVCSCGRGAGCKAPGKHPHLKGWKTVNVFDERENSSYYMQTSEHVRERDKISTGRFVAEWWNRWPNANVGLVMGGKKRIITLDVDGQRGASSLQDLEAQNEMLPETLTQRTGREGGEQRIFRVPEELDIERIRNTVGQVGDGLDVRAGGALIVVSPSIHRSGRRYEWIQPAASIADLPVWLYNLMAAPVNSYSDPTAPGWVPGQSGGIPRGRNRPQDDKLPPLMWRIGQASIDLAQLSPAIEGRGGSNATLKAAILLIRGYCLPPEEALKLLVKQYNPRCLPPWTISELTHKIDAAETTVKTPWAYRLGDAYKPKF